MQLGICCELGRLHEAAEAGFAFAEIKVGDLMQAENETVLSEVVERIRSSPLPVQAANGFLPGRMKVTGPEVDHASLREYMEKALGRMSRAGISVVVFGSGRARALPEGFSESEGWDQLTQAARMAAEIGDCHGVTIVMEPLYRSACNFFNEVAQGIRLVDRVNHPRLQLLADLFHMHAVDEPFSHLQEAGARLKHVHLATPAIPETGPGTEYDFEGFFHGLREAGYSGRVSIEDNPGLLANSEPPLTAVYQAMIRFLEEKMP